MPAPQNELNFFQIPQIPIDVTAYLAHPISQRILNTFLVFVIAYLLNFLLIANINRRVTDIRLRHTRRKSAIYIVNFLSIAVILFIWLQNLSSITLILGFLSAGVALALQEVILSIAAWFLIFTRRPFDIGDRIEINGIKGDIIDIRLFQISMLEIGNWVGDEQSTGRIVNVPNSFVFKYPHHNYSHGFEFIWNEIPILVTYESDWKKARQIMEAIAQKQTAGLAESVHPKIEAMKSRYMIYYGKLTPIVYVNIKDNGVELALRYLTEAKQRRTTQDQICQMILDEFAKDPSIRLASPTFRVVKE
jgi:small-conductance mechanosensitive channel